MAKTSKIAHAKKLKKYSKHSTKVYNRCQLCGRPRGYIREFGVCRICFRKLAHQGDLPGVKKLSQ